jgi:hypothetical protein
MRFYRGISVPASAVQTTITSISVNGLTGIEGWWGMDYLHPGPLDRLFQKLDLTITDTRTSQAAAGVCACGEESGAAYYAWHHNRGKEDTTPIMMEIEADENLVAIDGRDFLYLAFQFGDPQKARPILERSFGPGVLRYADRAWNEQEHSCRIALCDLAIHDPEVVRAHHASDFVLGGRHGTVFRNAFIVKLPVGPEAIRRVWSPSAAPTLPVPEASLADVLGRNR